VVVSEPSVDVIGVEAQEVTDLVMRDSPLSDEPANVSHAHREVARHAVDVEERTSVTRGL
jgi:hypothetical protein